MTSRFEAFRSVGAVALLLCGSVCPPPAAGAQELPLLDCSVYKMEPRLDFEFRFFSGYGVEIPIKQMIGPERPVLVRTRVLPVDPEGAEPFEFFSEGVTAEIPQNARGVLEISGSFGLGEGRYHVTWEMIDSLRGRCRLEWDLEASPNWRDRDVLLSLKPGEIRDSRIYLFRPETVTVAPQGSPPLRVKVLLNLDPTFRSRRRPQARVRLYEYLPRLAAMRALSRHPRIGSVSLVAFASEEQKVFHEHGLQDHFAFPALRDAVDEISPALVSFDQLGKYAERDFFSHMIQRQIPGDETVDAYIFIGPEAEFGRKPSGEILETIRAVHAPVFFLTSDRFTWKGLIGHTVEYFGGKTFKFANPRDLAEVINKLIERIEGDRP